MRTFYLIRHGETEWNRLDKKQGHTDIPMNETGHQQAKELQQLVGAFKIERVISSDLTRALETARGVFPGMKIENDPRLREVHIEIGESEEAALRRLDLCLEHWFAAVPRECLGFVTHGMLIRLFAQRCLGVGFRAELRAPNCSVYQFRVSAKGMHLHQIFHR